MKKLWFVEAGPDSRHPINTAIFPKYREALDAFNASHDKAKRLGAVTFPAPFVTGQRVVLREVFA